MIIMSILERPESESVAERVLSGPLAVFERHKSAYLMIAPTIMFLLLVVGYPIYRTLQLSFFEAPRTADFTVFVGLQNYVQILQSDIFYQILWQTVRWIGLSVTMKTVLGLFIAIHLNKKIAGRKFFRTAFLIPWGIPYAITAIIFRWMEHPQYGYINTILLELGLISQPVGILGSPQFAWLGAIVADIWIGTPFMIIVFLAGLQSIPQELYEAASIDGVYGWAQFRRITLPQLKPVILIATLMSTIWTFVAFDVIWTMTQGGPLDSTATLVIWIYKIGFEEGSLGMAAAYSGLGFVILGLFAVLYVRLYTSRGDVEL